MSVVEVDRLTKRFGQFTAVDQITFQVEKGEIFGFLGPNGAGKSTTIRMLCTLLQPTSGSAKGRRIGSPTARSAWPGRPRNRRLAKRVKTVKSRSPKSRARQAKRRSHGKSQSS